MAPQIDDLEGKLKFTEEEINIMQEALDKYNIQVNILLTPIQRVMPYNLYRL